MKLVKARANRERYLKPLHCGTHSALMTHREHSTGEHTSTFYELSQNTHKTEGNKIIRACCGFMCSKGMLRLMLETFSSFV